VADAVTTLNAIVTTGDMRDPYTSGVPLGWEACDGSVGQDACSPSRPIQDGKHNRPSIPADYKKFLNDNGLDGARLGLTRSGIQSAPPQVQMAFYEAIEKMGAAGATIIDLDNADCSGITGAFCSNPSTPFPGFSPADGELLVLEFDFRNDLAKYFATRKNVPAERGTLQTAIDFNNANVDVEMPYFFQEIFLQAEALNTGADDCQPGFSSAVIQDAKCPVVGAGPARQITYNDALLIDHMAGVSFDKALDTYNLNAIVAPTDSPGWTSDLILSDHFLFASSGLAGPPGYPIINVPAGDVLGMPVGVSFIGTAFSERTLIPLASGFEAVTHARFEPTFAEDVTTAHTSGTLLSHPSNLNVPPKKHHHRM
jgi:amidase